MCLKCKEIEKSLTASKGSAQTTSYAWFVKPSPRRKYRIISSFSGLNLVSHSVYSVVGHRFSTEQPKPEGSSKDESRE